MNLSHYKMRLTDTHVYFWGGPFSNWFKSTFSAELPLPISVSGNVLKRDGNPRVFTSNEKYMMAAKASAFGDAGSLSAIMKKDDPAEVKKLGRGVLGFSGGQWTEDEIALWDKISTPLVTIGCIAKFSQSLELFEVLSEMGGRRFVEGSPQDKLWGVGLRYDDPRIEDERNWLGPNKLGGVLDDVYDISATFGADTDPWKALSAFRKSQPVSPAP